MNAINLAILCMGKNLQNFCEYKNSLTQLYKDKKIKNDEVETLIEFVKALSSEITKMSDLDYFFYGFRRVLFRSDRKSTRLNSSHL